MVVGGVVIVDALNMHDEGLSVLILPLPFGPALLSILDIVITGSKVVHAEVVVCARIFFVLIDHRKSAIPQNPRKSVRVGRLLLRAV